MFMFIPHRGLPINLTEKSDGNSIDSPEELATEWFKFLEKKFEATETEKNDREWAGLPPRDPSNVVTDKEFNDTVTTLKKGKATGSDNTPIEVYKASYGVENPGFQDFMLWTTF